MDPGESLGDRLRAHWIAQGLIPPKGVSEERLHDFESRYGVRLPPDLRDYFLTVNGMWSREEWDDDFFTFWPLDDVVPASSEFTEDFMEDASSFFVFADHFFGAPYFAVKLTASGTSGAVIAVFADNRQYDTFPTATSFEDFGERYLESQDSRLGL
jgi:hypothetical protein